jgi:sugar phosphate isomerase/epimerase
MNPISIDCLSVMGMPPVAFVELAAELGCNGITTTLTPFPDSPYDFPTWSLRDDRKLCRELRDALVANGVILTVGEGFMLRPGVDFRDSEADLEILRELGAQRINAISIDPDRGRTFDQLALLAECAANYELGMLIEFAPIMTVRDLPAAVEAARYCDQAVGIVVDALHLARSGGTPADIAAADAKYIGYVQLCDAPREWTAASYMEEARWERQVPGEGELPLRELLQVLPRHVTVGLEVPRRSRAQAGDSVATALAPVVAAARRLLAELN